MSKSNKVYDNKTWAFFKASYNIVVMEMLYFDMLKNILIIGIAAGIVTASIIQKIKSTLTSKKYLVLINFLVSMIIGPLFALTFSDVTLVESLWSGLFSFVGADVLYQTFENKIFKPFSEINKTISIPTENNIRR